MEDLIKCPKCSSTQITAHKKGWSLMTGMIGANAIKITCLKCGYTFSPKKNVKKVIAPLDKKTQITFAKFLLYHILLPVIFMFIIIPFLAILIHNIFK
tara:strand:- start:186 stop:479 length:294 start_codon:yes stop_codon:yes gene_type:complete